MKKRYFTIALAFLFTQTAMICSAKETPAKAEELFASVMYDIAQAPEGSGLRYDAGEQAQNLNAWIVTMDEQHVTLETLESTYVLDACYTDSLLSFGKAAAYKYAFDQFIEEEILITVDREDLGTFTVSDDNFDEYIEVLEEAGYSVCGPDADDFIKELDQRLNGGTKSKAPSFGKFQNDIFIPSGSIVPGGSSGSDSGSDTGSYEDDYCDACHNTGLCETCHGAGSYPNPWDLTQRVKCTCDNGKCPVCGGK